jgi:signal transduction histidine kinase
MKIKSLYLVLDAYIRMHKAGIILISVLFLLSGFVSFLYGLPAEAVLYFWLLWLVTCGLSGCYDFYKFRNRYNALQQAIIQPETFEQVLPHPGNIIEEQYQHILQSQAEARRKLASEQEQKQQEVLDYYTMWVHQIKTPIAAMNLMLQINDGPDYNRLRASLFKIEQYADMVLQYIRSDSKDLVISQCRLDEVVRQAIHKYAAMFIDKKIGLQYEPVECKVLTDEKWLQFVVEQILSNALKYTKEGTISIQTDLSGPYLIIEDTGIGIEPEDLQRIFENGYTGNNGRIQKRASGIGLYLCRKIMTRLGHKIEIESKPDYGTKVKLYLGSIDLKLE